MLIEGEIRPIADSRDFNREAWCRFVSSRSEFQRYPPQERPNPFTGAMMTIHTPPDAALVIIEGHEVGSVSWSMSDDDLVNVSIDSSAIPLVMEWAKSLGGEFRASSS
jgi:hypothetical protein